MPKEIAAGYLGHSPSLSIAPTHTWGRAYLRDLAWNGLAVGGALVDVPDDLIMELAEPSLGVLDAVPTILRR
jgi:hypothetical protein